MGRIFAVLLILPLFLFFLPFLTDASDVGLEKSLQNNLEKSRGIIKKAQERLKAGYPVTAEINELKALYEEIKASHLLVEERFRLREEEVKVHGVKALERHRFMSDNYSRALRDYLSLIEGLSSPLRTPQSAFRNLESLLDQTLSRKKRPILGSLPYKNLKYPWREPNESPPIKPAYRGGNKTVTPDDLKSTLEAPISMEIGTLAQSLTWNPVLIYEWVKNNIETEWYWGCMKGAEETLRQRRGNDCDQAALLVALLRASGYPTRYVRGVIEFYPDIEKAKNLIGVDDPSKIPEYFQKAGIPHKTIVAGGKVSNIQIEHIWVETQVPYANYRGAILDEHGKTWLGLDTSIKVKGYTYNSPIDIPQEISLANLRDEYLATPQDLTPLEYTRTYINSQLATRNPSLTYNDLLKTKALIPEVLNILPASLQFKQVKITHEYAEIPDELKHRVRFIAARNSQPATSDEILNINLDTLKLSNQRIAVSYEPETVEDQEIINSYGGLDNTPAYLIRLRPVLKINGERIAVGKDGLPMGGDYDLTVELISPNGTEKVTNTHITGNLAVLGIVAQKAVAGSGLLVTSEEDKDAEQILYEEAIRYIDRWNQAEEELASLMKLTITRPIPTVVTLGGVIDVTYLLDIPHGFEWKGVYVDADLRAVEIVGSRQNAVGREKIFMQLSALQGSILENRIFEDDFQVESISTAKLFGLARNTQPATELLTIDKTNIDTILPTLPFDENIKEDIFNAVNQNFAIRIPSSEIVYEEWTGVGYIKENPNTGESGYMLSGMIAGGMTAWGITKWNQSLADLLRYPFEEPPNKDSASARYIRKIGATDLQSGKVGQILPKSLQVIVTDKENNPVRGAKVIFKVKAGKGTIINPKTQREQQEVEVETEGNGIAEVKLKLGLKTSDNPSFMKIKEEEKYYTQVGENIVEASLPSGIKITKPFTAYGFPKEPSQIKQTHGGGKSGPVLSFAGFISVSIEDIHGNPISNLPVTFRALTPIELDPCEYYNQDFRQAVVVKVEDPCLKNSPTWGECASASSSMEVKTNSMGAAVEVILGAIPGAQYPIEAASGNLGAIFNFNTYLFGNCSGVDDPSNEFELGYVYPSDSYGNNINAGRVGSTIPVMARMYFLREQETQREFAFMCGGDVIRCNKVIGTREYYVDTNFTTGSVSFDGAEGSPKGDGIYVTNYTLKPGRNDIQVNASASVNTRKTVVCPACITSTIPLSLSNSMTIQVYGVEIQVGSIPVILVDKDGYTTKDHTITYTINPPEYKALTAFVLITKDGDPIVSIPAQLQGNGVATISQGFWFDANSQYDAEVVLNFGTGVEIRSEKVPLTVVPVSFEVFPDEETAISADDASVYIVAIVSMGKDPVDDLPIPAEDGTIVEWLIEEGTEGSLSEQQSETRDGFATVILNTSTTPGHIYKVKANLKSLITTHKTVEIEGVTALTNAIKVAPGLPASITITKSKESYRSDMTDTVYLEATVKDSAGNLVEDGTEVSWLLDKSTTTFISLQPFTLDGRASATLLAPIVPYDQIIEVVAGQAVATMTITVSRVTGSLASSNSKLDIALSQTATLTASVDGADGTPVLWTTSNGTITSESHLSEGKGTATLSSANGHLGAVLVTASIGDRLLIWEGEFTSSSDLTVKVEHPILIGDAQFDGVETVTRPDGSSYQIPYWASTAVFVQGPPNAVANVSTPGNRIVAGYSFDSIKGNVIPGMTGEHDMVVNGAILDFAEKRGGDASLYFDSNALATIPDAPDLDFPYNLNISLWVRPSFIRNAVLISKGTAWKIEILGDGRIRGTIQTSQGTYTVLTDASLRPGVWTLLQIEVESGVFRITLDDETVVDNSFAGAILTNDESISIGLGLHGHIDDLLISKGMTGPAVLRFEGLDSEGRLQLDPDGIGTFRIYTDGVFPAEAGQQIITIPVRVNPSGRGRVFVIQKQRSIYVDDAILSFLGGDPKTSVGTAANIAGGVLIVGDIGSVVKNLWRMVGFSEKEPNHAELILSGLGLLTEFGVGVGEIVDVPVSTARAIAARIGNSPLVDLIVKRIKGAVLAGEAVTPAEKAFLKAISGDENLKVFKAVIESEDVFKASIRASDKLGSPFYDAIRRIYADLGETAARRTTQMLGELSDDVLDVLKSSPKFNEAVEGLAKVLKAGIDPELAKIVLKNDNLYTAAYKHAHLLSDLGAVAEVKGLEILMDRLRYGVGKVYPQALGFRFELEAAAWFKRNGYEVLELTKRIGGKTDIDIVIEEAGNIVYVQCKRSTQALGYGEAALNRTIAWVSKAMKDLEKTYKIKATYANIRYVVPPDTWIPRQIAGWFTDEGIIPFYISHF